MTHLEHCVMAASRVPGGSFQLWQQKPLVCNQLANFSAGLLGDSPLREGLVQGFLLILFSELGDKTFFIAVLLALKQNKGIVFGGTFGALAVMSVISVSFPFQPIPVFRLFVWNESCKSSLWSSNCKVGFISSLLWSLWGHESRIICLARYVWCHKMTTWLFCNRQSIVFENLLKDRFWTSLRVCPDFMLYR